MNFLIAPISLGFLGSFHCIGMCGPIAMALPVHHKPALVKYALIFSYNFGRIVTYACLGLLAGIIGKSFVLAGLQQGLSVSLGIILLAYVFIPYKKGLSGYSFFLWVQTTFARVFSIGTKSSLFLVGLLNGLLPCGLVYMGLAGAIATGDVLKGAFFMTGFGLGTLPMMVFVPLAGSIITVSLRNKIKKAVPMVLTTMALFLILRGLNLGIPYLSPKLNGSTGTVICHQLSPDQNKLIRCGKIHK